MLWVLAENRTDAGVRFSAESHGEGLGGFVEARRSGSTLFDAGAMHPGSYLLPVMVVADGRPATIDLPIECRPSGMLRVRIVDDATGEPTAARVYLRDDVGPAWPVGATIRRDDHGNAFFHAEGTFEVRVSGTARLRVVRGIEYEAAEFELPVRADAEVDAPVRLRRWSHMAADGWYSGDVHVHLHYGGEYLLEAEDAALVQRAEDVNFLNMMVANQGSGWVHDTGTLQRRRPRAEPRDAHPALGRGVSQQLLRPHVHVRHQRARAADLQRLPEQRTRARPAVERRRRRALPQRRRHAQLRAPDVRERRSRRASSRRNAASASRRRNCPSMPRSATSTRSTSCRTRATRSRRAGSGTGC